MRMIRKFTIFCGLLAGMMALTAARSLAQQAVVPVVAGHTTLEDRLQLPMGEIRTLAQFPRIAAWGLVTGQPESGDQGVGIDMEKVGQGVIYGTTDLLAAPMGTIEFMVHIPAPAPAPATGQPAAPATNPAPAVSAPPALRTLLDSWPANGNSRIQIGLTPDNKITLVWTDENNNPKTVQGNVSWRPGSSHKIQVLWDAADVTLTVDGEAVGKIDKPNLFNREPLGIILGNARDFQSPALLAVSDLRLSTIREPQAPAILSSADDNVAPEEISLRTAEAYQRRLYPLLERLRQQNVGEVSFAYAMAYNDINDLSRALDMVTPIANDPNNPLYVQAIFLRADLLMEQKDYNGATDQLEILAASNDPRTRVRARIKEAVVLFAEGSKADANRLISDMIARYPNISEVNEAYLMVGLEKFKSGDFGQAYAAFSSIGLPGALPRASMPIGAPLIIKLSDPDKAVRVTDTAIPVTVKATSGDEETFLLKPAFSRGLYVGQIQTQLGAPKKGDGILEVEGGDRVEVSYTRGLTGEPITVGLNLATDAKISVMSLSALPVFREGEQLIKDNVLDKQWEVISDLPKDASSFFRNPDDGTLRKKGFHFDTGFMHVMRAGQGAYIEVNDPDEDKDPRPDSVQVEVSDQAGKKITVTLPETANYSGIFAGVVKTTPMGQPQDGMLEVATNDTLTVRYVDPLPMAGSHEDPVKIARMTVRATDGTIDCQVPLKDVNDEDRTVMARAVRVSNGTTVTVKVNDRDLDTTDGLDKVTVSITAQSGAQMPLVLTETDVHSGLFAGHFILSTRDTVQGDNVFKAKPGDLITATYVDQDNSTGQPVNRQYIFRANIAEDAVMDFERQVVTEATVPKDAAVAWLPPPIITWVPATSLIPGSVYRITLHDGDLVPTTTGQMFARVKVKSTDGSTANVTLGGYPDEKSLSTVFTGDFFVRLGDASSPSQAFFSQTGAVMNITDENDAYKLATMPAVNVQGNDKVQFLYVQPLAADGKTDVPRTQTLRVADDAVISVLDMEGNPLTMLKPGMPFELQVDDAEGDISPRRDSVKATITSSSGAKLVLNLLETDIHSGEFSAIVKTEPVGGIQLTATVKPPPAATVADKTKLATSTKPAAGAASTIPAAIPDNVITVPFNGKLTILYHQIDTVVGGPADRTADLVTRPLMDAQGVLLTKVFDDPKFEVDTLVRLGESLYAVGAAEMMNSGVKTGTNAKLREAAVLLQSVIDRFPTSDRVVECLYLTGKVRQQEQRYDEAVKLYNRVLDDYPDSDFVPQALYQLVGLYYDQAMASPDGTIDKATEAAMRLIYGYPQNPLVADAFLKIAGFYYERKQYLTAAYIYKRVIERFPDNSKIALICYRRATAFYKAGMTDKNDHTSLDNAVRYFLEFANTYKDHDLAPDALYWAANACRKQGDIKRCYTLLTKVLISYPDAEIKAYAARMRDEIKELYPNIEADQM